MFKIFCPIVAHTKITRVTHLRQIFFNDVIPNKDHITGYEFLA